MIIGPVGVGDRERRVRRSWKRLAKGGRAVLTGEDDPIHHFGRKRRAGEREEGMIAVEPLDQQRPGKVDCELPL